MAEGGAGRAGDLGDVHSFPHSVPLLCRAVPHRSAKRRRGDFLHVRPVRLYGGSVYNVSGEFKTLTNPPRNYNSY